jgi:hypothetical protein
MKKRERERERERERNDTVLHPLLLIEYALQITNGPSIGGSSRNEYPTTYLNFTEFFPLTVPFNVGPSM